jgi:hypothetical protein
MADQLDHYCVCDRYSASPEIKVALLLAARVLTRHRCFCTKSRESHLNGSEWMIKVLPTDSH